LNFEPDTNIENTKVIDFLRTEWEKVKDTIEVFSIETTSTDLQPHNIENNLEVLRMSSPPFKHRRRQCPSPDSQEQRLLTPRKQGSAPSSRGHTPRKDTPVKKRTKLQCRNTGCRDYLAFVVFA
jgi:hypothetical protein